MVNLENHLLLNILETLNEIIVNPNGYDYAIGRDERQQEDA